MGTLSKHSIENLISKEQKVSLTETLDVSKTEVKENIYSHFAFTFEHFIP